MSIRRAAVGAISVSLFVSLALAQGRPDRKVHFDVPAQSLNRALTEYAEQSGLRIVFYTDVAEGVRSRALEGDLTLEQALQLLLTDSRLRYQFVDDRTVSILAADDAKKTSSNAVEGSEFRLAQTDAPAATTATDSLEEVVVRATEFRYTEAESAYKMPLSVKDTPQTIKVITQDLLDFATIQKFEDLYKVDASGGVSHAGDQFPRNYYRGFMQQGINAIKIDGFRMVANINLDLSAFERFEVVKGATSTLYGQNSISGTLNAISKAPTDTFGGEVQVEGGSYSHYRAQADVHGPIDADGRLTYRMVGAYQNAGTYLDLDSSRVIALAPTIKYQIADSTSLTARLIYQKYTYPTYFGIGAQFVGTDISDPAQLVSSNFVVPPVPRSRSGGAPWNHAEKDATFAQTILEHHFAETWQLRGSLQYQRITGRADAFQTWNTDQNGHTFGYLYGRDQENDVFAAEVNLFGDIELFEHRHTLFFGADYAEIKTDTLDLSSSPNAPNFSILAPDWSQIPPHRANTDYDFFNQSQSRHQISGATVQLLARPLDGLTVSLGARFSDDRLKNRNRSGPTDQISDSTDVTYGSWSPLNAHKVTSQAGLTYALTPTLNVYSSYGNTFEPRSGLIYDGGSGRFVNPEAGRAYEAGLKGDALANKFSYSLAVFDMQRSNILQSDPLHPGFVLQVGTQRSRGVEVDFQGRLAPGLEVYGSLAKLDAKFVKGQFAGLPSANAPDFGLSLFGSYQVQGGPLRNLGFGAGVVRKTGMETFDAFNYGQPVPFNLGGFTEVDLRVFYDHKPWRFEVSATNVLNTLYYSPYSQAMWFGLEANPPRQVVGRVSYRF